MIGCRRAARNRSMNANLTARPGFHQKAQASALLFVCAKHLHVPDKRLLLPRAFQRAAFLPRAYSAEGVARKTLFVPTTILYPEFMNKL